MTKADGSPSVFAKALREMSWMPADNAEANADSVPFFRPGQLFSHTTALREVFSDPAFLASRTISVVSGDFAVALGLTQQPSVDLVIEVLANLDNGVSQITGRRFRCKYGNLTGGASRPPDPPTSSGRASSSDWAFVDVGF